MPPISRRRLADSLVGEADRLVRRRQDLARGVELDVEPVGEHLELELADGGEDRRAVAHLRVAEHLHHALLVELGEALAELLDLAAVERAGGGEHLGREPRDRRELDRRSTPHSESPMLQPGGVDEADHVAGERLLDRAALGAEHRRRVLRGERLAGALAREHHAALEAARADAHEGDPVAVGAVHVGLHLEHERRAVGVERPRLVVDVGPRRRRRGEVDDGVEQRAARRSW